MRIIHAFAAIILIWLAACAAHAEAPIINYVFPPGAQRGATIEAAVSGAGLVGAAGVRFAAADVAGRIVRVVNSKTVLTSVQVGAAAELGEHDIRLITPRGATNRYRFQVGQLPEVNSKQVNTDRSNPQRLASLPILVNGQILQGRRDYYRFSAAAGKTLVCAIQGRAIQPYIPDAVPGWMDACLTLFDSKGAELASMDDFHVEPDPVLLYRTQTSGDFLLEVRDILDRGREDFVYRLSVGALPFIAGIFPLGGQCGTTTHVALDGVNLPGSTLDLAIPADTRSPYEIHIEIGGLSSNRLSFAVGDAPETLETEPNGSPATANRVAPPVAIDGRIDQPGDADYFAFPARAGQTLVMEIQARRLGSMLDSILALFDAQGHKLAENDDTVDPELPLLTRHSDSRLMVTFAANGDYVLRVLDVQGKCGADYFYRLVIAPPRPDFALRVTPDNPHLTRGGSVTLTVSAIRKDGFDGEIPITVRGLPQGITVSASVIAHGQDAVTLNLTAAADAEASVFAPTILGSALIDGTRVSRSADAMEAVMQAYSYVMYPTCREIVVTVGEGIRHSR